MNDADYLQFASSPGTLRVLCLLRQRALGQPRGSFTTFHQAAASLNSSLGRSHGFPLGSARENDGSAPWWENISHPCSLESVYAYVAPFLCHIIESLKCKQRQQQQLGVLLSLCIETALLITLFIVVSSSASSSMVVVVLIKALTLHVIISGGITLSLNAKKTCI